VKVGIVGAGWAGLAAAVTATEAGHEVTVFEMAGDPGGRAKRISGSTHQDDAPDNGQHILIGAYQETLKLMAKVGINPAQALHRTPLHLVDAQGQGLRLPPGPPAFAFMRGVWGHSHWSLHERWSLIRHAALWRWQGFECAESLTVDQLTRALAQRVKHDLIEPLCVAAMNTNPREASAQIFLRVLRDALLAGPGSADLLFPRLPLSDLWPMPAVSWLQRHGATLKLRHRIQTLSANGRQWLLDKQLFDQVILACTPHEAARLCQPLAPLWAAQAASLQHEPIATVFARSQGTRLPTAMVRLDSDDHERPVQFVLDHGHWSDREGYLAFVISGAQPWAERGHEAIERATLRQAEQALGPILRGPLQILRTLIDKRATFRCSAGLTRPSRQITQGLQAAGDYVAGPYPATLEGAVQSGVKAAQQLATGPANA
jgi:squalene-associated FAD-dependent desaturase